MTSLVERTFLIPRRTRTLIPCAYQLILGKSHSIVQKSHLRFSYGLLGDLDVFGMENRGYAWFKQLRMPPKLFASSSSDRTVTTPSFAERLDVFIRDRVRARFVLADNAGPTIEGNIIGRDDELNLVVNRAVELDILGRTSELGRIMLAANAYITFSGLFKIA